MIKTPIIDLRHCNMCMSCIETCPEVFKKNSFGYIEITEMPSYPCGKIEEAIKYCPQDCIEWNIS